MTDDDYKDFSFYEGPESITIDQGVYLMLGHSDISKVEFEIKTDNETLDHSLFDTYFLKQERLETEISNIDVDLKTNHGLNKTEQKKLQAKTTQLQTELDNVSKEIDKGNQYRQTLSEEVAKARQGQKTDLLIDWDKSTRNKRTYIFRRSFENWKKSFFEKDFSENSKSNVRKGITWEKVIIQVNEDELTVAYKINSNKLVKASFKDLGLLYSKEKNKRSEPSLVGKLLIAYSLLPDYYAARIPESLPPTKMDKRLQSDLSNFLRKWILVRGKPFNRLNPTDGWKPRFIIKNTSMNSSDRSFRETMNSIRQNTADPSLYSSKLKESTNIDSIHGTDNSQYSDEQPLDSQNDDDENAVDEAQQLWDEVHKDDNSDNDELDFS